MVATVVCLMVVLLVVFMAVVLVVFMAVALQFLTAVLFSIGRCLCTTLPTERVGFPARFFVAWSLPALLDNQLRIRAPSGFVGKLTLHTASLGFSCCAFFAVLAQARPQYGCVVPFSTNFGRVWHC